MRCNALPNATKGRCDTPEGCQEGIHSSESVPDHGIPLMGIRRGDLAVLNAPEQRRPRLHAMHWCRVWDPHSRAHQRWPCLQRQPNAPPQGFMVSTSQPEAYGSVMSSLLRQTLPHDMHKPPSESILGVWLVLLSANSPSFADAEQAHSKAQRLSAGCRCGILTHAISG